MLAIFMLAAGLVSAPAALGQTPTTEQVEAFRDLSPEQQRTVLEAMGGGNGQSGAARSDQRIESPATVLPRSTQDERLRNLTLDGEPRLAAGDTLIVELEPVLVEGEDRVLTERPRQPAEALQEAGATPGRAGERDYWASLERPWPSRQRRCRPRARRIQRTKSEQADLDRFIETVRSGNPYRLDRTGALDLPGLGLVPLAGLTVLQATQRLAIEPFLRDFRIRLTLLPLEPVDTDALKPFGYDLFAGVPTTFAPVTDVPVPSEYVIGPGDRFDVQLIGNTKGKHSLVVNRDGRVMFPELGPIAVSGLRVDEARPASSNAWRTS